MNRCWICSDVWMDILPSFDHAQLGLKMALLSDRFDLLVDKHFDGKKEFTLWNTITISKCEEQKAKLSVVQPIWDVFIREIWPIFVSNIRHLSFFDGDHLDNLRRRTSPTILNDLDQLNSIDAGRLLPGGIADDGQNATAGQALSKWLHTPRKNSQPKRFRLLDPSNLEWVNDFKETFRRATTSVSFNIQLFMPLETTPIEQFELVNGRTKEKLTLSRYDVVNLLMKRCPISEKAAAIQWENDENSDANLNNIKFILWSGGINFIGPLSRPTEEEKEKADQSIEMSSDCAEMN